MIKKTSCITLSNKGYIKYTKNLITSLEKNKINIDLSIFVMDKYSYDYFKKLNQKVLLIEGKESKKFLKQDSENFGIYMLQKLKIIYTSLLDYENVLYLDGDIVRLNLSQGLGFSPEDRSINVRRIGFVCSEVVKHGGVAVAANIAPFANDREFNKGKINSIGHYIEIFVDTTIDDCEKRDVKGLYKLAREGVIKEFTGISSPFEKPENPNIILSGSKSIEENVHFNS